MIHKRHSIFLWIPAAAFTGAIVLLLLHIPSGQPSQHPPREPTVAAPQAAVAFPSNRVLAVFLDEPSEPILWSGKNPAARRARPIQPAPHWLAPGFKPNSGDWIELPLFSNAVFRAQIRSVTGHPGGTTGLTAHTPDGQTTIFLTFSDGQIRASVETAGGRIILSATIPIPAHTRPLKLIVETASCSSADAHGARRTATGRLNRLMPRRFSGRLPNQMRRAVPPSSMS